MEIEEPTQRNIENRELKGWKNEFVDPAMEEAFNRSRVEALGSGLVGAPLSFAIAFAYVFKA
jgi:2-keto-4-pentenoate hydratase